MTRAANARSSTRSQLLLNRLRIFFRVPERRKVLADVLQHKTASLRMLEHFVTKPNGGVPVLIPGTVDTLHDSYAQNLKSYGKNNFDPFCRGERVHLPDVAGLPLSTTVGQLNFMRFCVANNVMDLFSKYGTPTRHLQATKPRCAKRVLGRTKRVKSKPTPQTATRAHPSATATAQPV